MSIINVKNNLTKISLLIMVSILFTGCWSIAHTVGTEIASGKVTSFTGTYKLDSKKDITKTENDFIKTLINLDFHRNSNTELSFTKENSKGASYALSKVYTINVNAELVEDKITIIISQVGNYKYGTEKKTNETFEEIKKEYFNIK